MKTTQTPKHPNTQTRRRILLFGYLGIWVLGYLLPAHAQFARSSDSNLYPYALTFSNDWTFIMSQPTFPTGTNHNFSGTNMNQVITNASAYQAFLATNGWTAVATNIAAYQAFLATNNNFNGNSLTNLNGQEVRYRTNQALATSIDVGNKYTGFATNNNISIAGCANVDATGTNISWGILTITNTAGSSAVKTIAIPAAWVDVDNLGGTTIYNTNQGVLSVMVYPNLGTNFIWRGK